MIFLPYIDHRSTPPLQGSISLPSAVAVKRFCEQVARTMDGRTASVAYDGRLLVIRPVSVCELHNDAPVLASPGSGGRGRGEG